MIRLLSNTYIVRFYIHDKLWTRVLQRDFCCKYLGHRNGFKSTGAISYICHPFISSFVIISVNLLLFCMHSWMLYWVVKYQLGNNCFDIKFRHCVHPNELWKALEYLRNPCSGSIVAGDALKITKQFLDTILFPTHCALLNLQSISLFFCRRNWLPPCPERSWIWLHVPKTR